MKYADGRLVVVGDRVNLWRRQPGTVVCSIDTDEFTADFPRSEWAYLERGVLIRADGGGLFHYTEPDEDFERIEGVDNGPGGAALLDS